MMRCARLLLQTRCKRCLSSIIVPGKDKTCATVDNVKRIPATSDIEDIFNKKLLTIIEQKSGLFGNTGLTNPEDFGTQLNNVITKCDDLVRRVLEEKPSGQIKIQLLDEIVENIATLTDLAAFIAEMHADPEFRHAAQQTCKKAEMYVAQFNRNPALFQSLRDVIKNEPLWQKLDKETKQVAQMLLLDFEHSGAHLSKQKQENLIKLTNEINRSGIDFIKEAYKPAVIPLKSCPVPLLGFPLKDGKIVLKDWCHNHVSDSIREHAWKHYYKYDKRREMLLHNILDQRQSLARDTGFNNYAERALQGSMAENPETVGEFIDEVKIQVRQLVREELIFVEIMKKEESRGWHDEQTMFPWDIKYYADYARNNFINIMTGKFHPSWSDFLSVGTVMEQIGVFFEELYNVAFVPEIPLTGELWSNDVIKLAVEHKTQGLIGFIYCDFYDGAKVSAPSPSHHLIQSSAKSRIPIVVVKCKYTASNGYRPAHLTFSTLDRLFYELGSAVHSMFSNTNFYQSSSSYIAPDIKNVSSHLLKEIGRNPAVLHLVLRHHTRKRILPCINPFRLLPISNAYGMCNAVDLENQLLYSAVDHRLHTEWPSKGQSSTEIFARLTEEYTHMPYIEGSAAHLRFTPLFTQGGTYYSHLWCKAIGTILYDEIFINDPFSRHGGEYFREHFLKHGASCNPRELVENLTGTKLTPQRLATALCRPIELSKNYEQGFNPKGPQGPGYVHAPKVLTTSPLLYRLAKTHPHLITDEGELTEKVWDDVNEKIKRIGQKEQDKKSLIND